MQLLVEEMPGQVALRDLATRRTRIGRAAECEIVLPGTTVSRLHATIDQVGDHHVLEDQGSSNGTFLNGVRIQRHVSFVLRPGDRIEIARARLVYGEPEDGAAESTDSSSDAFFAPERSYPVADLLAASKDEEAKAATTFEKEFEGAAPARALAACLHEIRKWLAADVAAVFVPHESHGVETLAAAPEAERLDGLAEIARGIMASERGKLVRQCSSDGASPHERTQTAHLVSALAVPLVRDDLPLGVLAVERRQGRAYGRAELVRLAVLAQRLGEALSLHCPSETDTRVGF